MKIPSTSTPWPHTDWDPIRCTLSTQIRKHKCNITNPLGHIHQAAMESVGPCPFSLSFDQRQLDLPRSWRKPRLVTVNSMSDLFHTDVPLPYIKHLFDIMQGTPRHRFMITTKFAESAAELAPFLPWPRNVWMGVTIENSADLDRIDFLRLVPATVRFLSMVQLTGPLPKLNLEGIHWVRAGGERGRRAGGMNSEWISDVKDCCISSEPAVPFKYEGRRLFEGNWDQFPAGAWDHIGALESLREPGTTCQVKFQAARRSAC